MGQHTPWWATAVFYQVYPRSFADGNGDGTGDLIGLRERLGYLRDLGVDALWISPFYPSPMADGGYDVADPCDVDPRFGTLADFDAMLAEAHRLGLKVTIDVVPNHFSDQHPWFQAALAAPPGSPERARFLFRPGRGEHGELPPNNWPSVFGGPAWQQVPDGDWYLHLFAPEQPDLDWTNPDVPAEFERILRFWLDRGVDGFRVDVAHGMAKPAGLPDLATLRQRLAPGRPVNRGPRAGKGGDTIYRVELSWVGEDPRLELREQVARGRELARLIAAVDKLDAAKQSGPWTRRILEWIEANPGVLASELAAELGRELLPMKADIRKLKALGLTISLRTGYQLSPRGEGYLRSVRRREARGAADRSAE